MTKEQLNLKIKKKFPDENFTIIDYQGMKKPLFVQCNNCKTTIQVQRAENFFRRKKGCNNCSETIEWKKQKDNFLLWLQSHPEYELIDDLNKIHKSQDHVRCKCTKCGRIQENKNVYDYYAQKQCFCQSKSTKKPLDQIQKDFSNICIFLEEYINANTPVLIESLACHHQFKVAPKDILRRPFMCPICKSSHGEKRILLWLEQNNISYCRQYKIDNYKVDFYLPNSNIIIEFNGIQHYEPVEHFGGKEKFIQQQHRDKYIQDYCIQKNIKLIEISYLDYEQIENILMKEVGVKC